MASVEAEPVAAGIKQPNEAPTIEKDSWDDFPIACPSCYGIMQPPLLESTVMIFPCIHCGIYLDKPTYLQRSLFYMDTSLYSLSRSWNRWWGQRFYTYLPVVVPKGCKGGDTVQAIYKGLPYHTVVPEGLSEGQVFKVKIDVTEDPPRNAFKAKRSQIGQGYEFKMPVPTSVESVVNETSELKDTEADTPQLDAAEESQEALPEKSINRDVQSTSTIEPNKSSSKPTAKDNTDQVTTTNDPSLPIKLKEIAL